MNTGTNLAVPGNLNTGNTGVETGQKSPVALPSPRRHQIPGLHQTPYLRIRLFRSDDKERYRNTGRKQLRDWVKERTSSSHSHSGASQQENHDAFEWLILHVVVPDTAAASEPRFTSASNKESNTASEKAGTSSKWPGKSSSTIYEKLKSDFNESGKYAADRVAQVRLSKSTAPPPTVPFPASQSYEMSPQEQEQAWDDVVVKMKALILMSFDLRVTQYEEDIREREAQRALPGWNFCTFFLLKEGLAKGFESVGLVDDALVVYDELSVGLDTVVRDQASEAAGNQAGAFLQYTEDLRSLTKSTAKEHEKSHQASFKLFEQPLSTTRKDYRELILSNNISIFDFKCYIFSRQMALLLRLSNIRRHSSKPGMDKRSYSEPPMSQRFPGQGSSASSAYQIDETEDIPSLVELCMRAISFIPAAARIMREDICQGYAPFRLATSPD